MTNALISSLLLRLSRRYQVPLLQSPREAARPFVATATVCFILTSWYRAGGLKRSANRPFFLVSRKKPDRNERTIQTPCSMISLRPSCRGGSRRITARPDHFTAYLLRSRGGGLKKTGSHCGRFPCQNPPGSRGSSRLISAGAPTSQRIRNVPQRRRQARGQRPSPLLIILKLPLEVLEILGQRSKRCGTTGRRASGVASGAPSLPVCVPRR